MSRTLTAILLVGLFSVVSCDILEEILRMAAYAEKYAMSNTVNKGYVTNCGMKEINIC